MSNPTASPIYYEGWPGPISQPNYHVESWDGTRWEEHPSGGCGNGLTSLMVPAGGFVEFATNHSPRLLPVRVRLSYQKAPGGLASEPWQKVLTERLGAQVREVAEIDWPRAVFND